LPNFYTISSVRSDLSRYKKNNSYGNCCIDLCSFFQYKSIEDIFNQPQVLYENGNFRYLKSRLDNSNNGKGKSCGYRLYYYVDREKESVTLLGFYPKVGKYGKPDISKTEEKK
jgi:mRNA-degrading endonuclease RelE of RelBE toxin-antitoxin system